MAWPGYFVYGGTEIINAPRVEAYADHAYWFRPVYKNDALGPMLGEEYASPLQDDAPWVDGRVPTSLDFWGVYPLDVTGIEDSTATATVTESTLDGGVVGRTRRATRSVVFNVALLGASECAVETGMRWLKLALGGGPCQGRSDQNCGGVDLCYLSCPPELDFSDTGQTISITSDNYLSLDQASFESTVADWHTIGAQPPTMARSTDHAHDGDYSLKITWPTGTSSGVSATLGGLAPGHRYDLSMYVFIPAGSQKVIGQIAGLAVTNTSSLNGAWQALVCSFTATATTHVVNLIASGSTTSGQLCYLDDISITETVTLPVPAADPSECMDAYLRSLHRVSITNGPIINSKATMTDGGCAWIVSFTATAGNPFEFGAETPLIRGFGDPNVAVPYVGGFVPEGGQFDDDGFVQTEIACPVPTYQPIFDPLCPLVVPPPAVPNITLNCFDFPVNYVRRQFLIPPQYVPQWSDVVPLLNIHARDDEIRNLRIRFYADVFQTGDPNADPCNYCGDMVVTYLPPASTLVLDGADKQVYVDSTQGKRRADSLVVASDGSPFEWPELTCGFGYVVTLDLPQSGAVPVVDLSLIRRVA